jgi:hypothetical protein
MMRFSILSLITLLLVGCGPHRDSIKLDALLTNRIDAVEIYSPGRTNRITGMEAAQLASSLQRTNRLSNTIWTKEQVQRVCLLDGTNVVGWLHLYDSGGWSFGDYHFRIRQ